MLFLLKRRAGFNEQFFCSLAHLESPAEGLGGGVHDTQSVVRNLECQRALDFLHVLSVPEKGLHLVETVNIWSYWCVVITLGQCFSCWFRQSCLGRASSPRGRSPGSAWTDAQLVALGSTWSETRVRIRMSKSGIIFLCMKDMQASWLIIEEL